MGVDSCQCPILVIMNTMLHISHSCTNKLMTFMTPWTTSTSNCCIMHHITCCIFIMNIVCLFLFCWCLSLPNLMKSIGGEICVVCNLNWHFYMLSLKCKTTALNYLQNCCTELLVMVLTCYFLFLTCWILLQFWFVVEIVLKSFAGLIVWGRREHEHQLPNHKNCLHQIGGDCWS